MPVITLLISLPVDNVLYCTFTILYCIFTPNNSPPGAEPVAADARPAYIFLKPPAFKNPSADCIRVFIVSKGKRMTSTAVPAIPPDYSDTNYMSNHVYQQYDLIYAKLQNAMPIYSTHLNNNSSYCCMHRSTKSSNFE